MYNSIRSKILFNSKDLMLMTTFSVLSAISMLLTNFFNLVRLIGIPGANGIYTQFFSCLFLWTGVLFVNKKFVVTFISILSALIGLAVPGGPLIVKPILIPYSIITGMVIDLTIQKFRIKPNNKALASIFGVQRGSHILIVQRFFGIHSLLGFSFFIFGSISGTIGGLFAISIFDMINRMSGNHE